MWTPYKTLQIAQEATQAEIKAAYKSLCQRWHPDKPVGDKDAYELVQYAYSFISTPQKRAHYDKTGELLDEVQGHEDVLATVQRLFSKMLAQKELAKLDYLASISQQLNAEIVKFERDISNVKQAIAKMEALMDAISTDLEDNIFHIVLSDQVQMAQNNLNVMTKQIDLNKRTLTYLEEYKSDQL